MIDSEYIALARPSGPSWPDGVCLPLTFEPAPLVADLARLSGIDWTAHFVRSNYDGDWSVLPLRAKEGATHPVSMIYTDPMATVFVDTPLLAMTPYFRAVIESFRCTVRAVRLMRLTPGSTIKEHSDYDLDAADGKARIHVPVATNAGVDFRLNRTPVVMPVGSVWYLRLSDPHSVHNGGETDRVHLVIDCEVNDWLAGQLG